jgi:glyoxylase-like metal-dependent hydrolase (beta-lactamase superfamily II)
MSDWDVQLVSAGSLPMEGALLGPAGTFADTRICSNVVLLRGGGRTVLIDTAAGQLDSEWEGATSNLAEGLAAHGCALTDIDTVVLTHLDFDHCGGAPDVPARRVVVTRTAAEWARALPADRSARQVLEAIAGRLDEADDGAEVEPGVRMVEAPGHRGGHACVEIGVNGSRRVFLADVIHHTSHVEHPEWDREFDTDPETGLATRRRWLGALSGTGVACAASHIDGWGTIEPDGDGYRWQPAG